MPSNSPRIPTASLVAIGIALLVLGLLLFSRLDHYALWDDEAVSALDAEGVLRTGYPSVLMDHGNIIAYRNGAVVAPGFIDRVDPPLPNYLTAGAFLVFGVHAWAGRLLFALFGFATMAVILFWGRREKLAVLVMLIIGLSCNVSLLLYCRQCRYYALSLFLTVAIVFIYWRWKPTPRTLLILAGLSAAYFATTYLNFLALYLCLAVDWFIWRRKEWTPTWSRVLYFLVPQLLVEIPVALIWNPFQTQYGSSVYLNSFWDRLILLCWYWRDCNQCEYFAIAMLLLALGVGIFQRRAWLIRGCVAIAVYLFAIAMISPQSIHITSVADLRYMAPIIPLAIAVEVGALWSLLQGAPFLAIAAAVIVFGSNLVNGGPLLPGELRSTIVSFAGELIDPPPDPYTLTFKWINENVPEGDSIWVLPDYCVYPLMFHAPRALYAWQLTWPPRADFAGLPRIHFMGQEAPDYLIAFGPALGEMAEGIRSMNQPGVNYAQVATIDIFWKDLYRPELFWRTFEAVKGYDPKTQAIYVFKRTSPPISPTP